MNSRVVYSDVFVYLILLLPLKLSIAFRLLYYYSAFRLISYRLQARLSQPSGSCICSSLILQAPLLQRNRIILLFEHSSEQIGGGNEENKLVQATKRTTTNFINEDTARYVRVVQA